MRNCPQTDTQSVLEHGHAVHRMYLRLFAREWDGMKIPVWFDVHFDNLLMGVYDVEVVGLYQIFHDCGKPFCIVEDEKGRHFPNHAEVSKEIFAQTFKIGAPIQPMIENLIGWDMVLHTATAAEIDAMPWSREDAFTLLVTALAEVHANAEMFGGIESDSFKIKWKKVNRRGKQLIKKFNQ